LLCQITHPIRPFFIFAFTSIQVLGGGKIISWGVNDVGMIFFSLDDPKDDVYAYLYACYWSYLHIYSKYSLYGRNPYLIEDAFVEISKTYFRDAIVKAGGNIAA